MEKVHGKPLWPLHSLSDLDVAAAGVLIIGTVIAIMRAVEKRRTRPIAPPPPVLARLRIIVTTLDPDPAIYSSILDRFECTATVVKSAADRDGKGLDLTLEVQDLAAEHYADLAAALLEVPEIAKATCNRQND